MRTAPLKTGETLPALDLVATDGSAFEIEPLLTAGSLVVYFMRTPTCPVCHSHLRQMGRARIDGHPLVDRLLVIVPGDARDAASVARRRAELSGRIVASTTAHAAVGLFTRAALQQSGTFVVGSDSTVLSARFSTVPLGAYDEGEVTAALAVAMQ